jgi:hypothetical protein
MAIFEWDEAKRSANIAKHGIDFMDAQEMFAGPMFVLSDTRKEYGEARQIGFGFVHGRLMAMVFIEREPGIIRIISARKANRREKIYFEETLADQLGKN